MLAPQRCIYCDQPSGAAEAICGYCTDALTRNRGACPRCALPDCNGNLCAECLVHPPLISRTIAPFCYDTALSYFMHRWKYQSERRLAKTAAKIMLNASIYHDCVDIILPTPLYWRRQLQRGFNQSHDLLEALCQLQPALHGRERVRLKRRRATAAQAGASRQERLRNLEGAFSVRGDVSNRRITLIDDVCTTGATANAMAKTLLDAGAAEVHLWCFARTPAS